MPDYVVRVSPTTQPLRHSDELNIEEERAMDEVRRLFPQIRWLSNFVCGPCEYIEILGAPDLQTAEHVAEQIRRHGLRTEVWPLAPAPNNDDDK